jgi:hypothetical protein
MNRKSTTQLQGLYVTQHVVRQVQQLHVRAASVLCSAVQRMNRLTPFGGLSSCLPLAWK